MAETPDLKSEESVTNCEECHAEESERGASLVEYALLVALIAVVAIVGVRTLGVTVSRTFSTINTGING